MLSLLKRILPLILLLLTSQAAMAARTDIVYLHNGDRITGEVKTLSRGKLEFKTDHMGTLYIEWTDIREIISDIGQAVELANGQRFYGPLAKPKNEDMVIVATEQGEVGLSTLDVIAMYPVEAGFWERLDLSVNLGFSWDKGSDVGKYSLEIETLYRRTKSITRVNLSTEITTQDDSGGARRDSTTRATLGGGHYVFRPNKRFLTYFGNLDHNDELGVDLRALGGAGYGWVPIRSQKNWFSIAGGLDVNHEIPNIGVPETNLEGVGMLIYEYFKYNDPERSFRANLMVFPSITDFGRWRADFSTDFKFEIVNDFFWNLDVYASYDSAPISREGASSDYGITSSLGYKF